MTSNSGLESTIDQVLERNSSEFSQSLKNSLTDAQKTLSDSLPMLEEEYEKIISDGKKEADKIEKQIVGSADLEARNKSLLIVQESVDKVLEKAKEKISNMDRNSEYSTLITKLLTEATSALDTSDVIVFTNSKDRDVVQSAVSNISGAELSNDLIDCMGGVKVTSKDGSMSFDNTIDARIELLKPLIRKDIAAQFNLGN
ncbi:MAG: V-type ATP synthase subunit E [Candidatus Nitrosopelagicus sp.]|nr:V-type ATP synthase subunit E [Candidatus Nitrosopelagicus sp.]MBT6646799.1 V-type ATP synthase subunit E [Nitrososphaerota archaeon]MBT3762063.1 V-type ATP synthase subunit E [Candidatus Nitrosopelagicus sp.]MBT4328146.1 V-type ATP synthase subunit E [Candidatus Nitrosopelagicus sp.]MBT4455097.1 V-type ATP synthase subunit E [Candidatus Nitrosopelagicus sp.]